MKKLFLSFVFLLGIASTSFAQRYIENVNYMESTAREISPMTDVMTRPIIAELEVDSRVEETITKPFENINVTSGIDLAMPTYKNMALAELAYMNNADLILGALIKVETTTEGKLAITISGYPARYIKFEKATKEDIELVRLASTVKSEDKSIDRSADTKTTVVKEKTLQLL